MLGPENGVTPYYGSTSQKVTVPMVPVPVPVPVPQHCFKYHIRTICAKTSRALYMLRTCKNLPLQKALKTLYYSLVHSHLVYGNQIWSSASAGAISELLRKQKAAIWIITNSRYNQHTEPLFKHLAVAKSV